ncbi:MAG: dephospho-CoA kinase [Planctomycetota bacterium]
MDGVSVDVDVIRKPVVGLMGQPGSGKSTVAAVMAELGGGVVDADVLARGVLAEPAVVDELVSWWGPEVRAADGMLDRAAVGRRVFSDPEALARLEKLVHPRVAAGRAALHAAYTEDPAIRFVVEDCPLLIETGLDASCDRLVLVEAPRQVRLERVVSRGWDAAELDRREAQQAPLDTRRERADDVITNAGDREQILEPIRRTVRSLLSPPL